MRQVKLTLKGILIYFLIHSNFNVQSQSKFIEGYIITNQYDTINGFIANNEYKVNSKFMEN